MKRLISKSADKLKRIFSFHSSDTVLIYPLVDIAVPSLDMAFIQLDLSPDLNELCNATYNVGNIRR